MINQIIFRLFNLGRFEHKLRNYNGYRHNSILRWKSQMELPWKTTTKLLDELRIFSATEIRQMLRQFTSQNRSLFNNTNCYVCSFGKPGKSGYMILYEFRHACPEYSDRIIEPWKIPSLPEKSKIIFIDDLVGSGQQSVEYISNTLNYFLNPSHSAFLLSLCGTPQGLQHVQKNTNFTPVCHFVLDEEHYQHYRRSRIFSDTERRMINSINNMLKGKNEEPFDKALLIAFYYSVPNNTMPLIWKDKYRYITRRGKSDNWYALLPRKY